MIHSPVTASIPQAANMRLIALILAALVWMDACAAAGPNVILIVADDLGYGDLGCFGSTTIATPRLDAMAREGMRFTDFYVAAPFCSPSRASILTGLLPARCGVPYVLFPAEHHGLPADEITIADMLRERGYATACIGKWHLGWDEPFRPLQHGFVEFFGLPYSNDSTEWGVSEKFTQVMGLQPLPLIDGDTVIEAPVDQSTLTRRYTERAVEFIRKNRERPFFLYLPHTMPHIPQYASPPFAGKSKSGLYGDVVEELDWSTGVLLDLLQELKIDERTLVIFTSDNGSPARPQQQLAKATKPAKAGGRFPGRDLAGSNGSLRGGKGTTFEGGIRVPAIAWWRKSLKAGCTIAEPISTLDLLPTIAALTGAKLPADRAIDGLDVSKLLLGEEPLPPRMLYHYFGPQLQAVREGKWKLFAPIEQLPEQRLPSLWFVHQPELFARQHRLWPKPTLYDLSGDVGETTDVATENVEVVNRLLTHARDFDAKFQPAIRPIEDVPGPPPPAPGEIRRQ
jgi:arylsulfatase A-like enzyme